MRKERNKQNPERSCVVCRSVRPTSELLALRASGMPAFARGRGAYVCIARRCLFAMSQQTVRRALRRSLPFDSAHFRQTVRLLAERRLLETVGLARRVGDLVTGTDRALGQAKGGPALIGTDLSERSLRHAGDAHALFTSDQLGRAVGMGKVGAMRIRSGRLADQATYWLRVWYEVGGTGSTGASGEPDKRGVLGFARDGGHELSASSDEQSPRLGVG